MVYLMKLTTISKGSLSDHLFYRLLLKKDGSDDDLNVFSSQGITTGGQSKMILNPIDSKPKMAKMSWWHLNTDIKRQDPSIQFKSVRGSVGALLPIFPPKESNLESDNRGNVPDLDDIRERLELLVEVHVKSRIKSIAYPVAIVYSREDFGKKTGNEIEEIEACHALGNFQVELLSLILEMTKREPFMIFGIFELSSWSAIDEINGIIDWILTWIINVVMEKKEPALPRLDLDFKFIHSFQQSIQGISTLSRDVSPQFFSKSSHLFDVLMDDSKGLVFDLIMTIGTLSRFFTETRLFESFEEANLPRTKQQLRNSLIHLIFNSKKGRDLLLQSTRVLVERVDETCRELDDKLNQWILRLAGQFSFESPRERTPSERASFEDLDESRDTIPAQPTTAERTSLKDQMEEFLQKKILITLSSSTWQETHAKMIMQQYLLFHVSEQWKLLLAQELESLLTETVLEKTSNEEERGHEDGSLANIISETELKSMSSSITQHELILGNEKQLRALLDEIVGFFELHTFHFLISFLQVDIITTRFPISIPTWVPSTLLTALKQHLSEHEESLSIIGFHGETRVENTLSLPVSFILHLIIKELNRKTFFEASSDQNGRSFSKNKIADRSWERLKEFLNEEWDAFSKSILSSFSPSWDENLSHSFGELQDKLKPTELESFQHDEALHLFHQYCWEEAEWFVTKLFFTNPFIDEFQCTQQDFHENGALHGPFLPFFSFLEKISHALMTTPVSTINIKNTLSHRIYNYNWTKERKLWNDLLRKAFIKLLEESLPRPWKLIPGDVDFPTGIRVFQGASRASQVVMTREHSHDLQHEQLMSLIPVMDDPDAVKHVPFILKLSWSEGTSPFPQVIACSCCSNCCLKPSYKDKNLPSFKPYIESQDLHEQAVLINLGQEKILNLRSPLDTYPTLLHHLQKIWWLTEYCHVLMLSPQSKMITNTKISHLQIPYILEQFRAVFGKTCHHFDWMLERFLPHDELSSQSREL